MLSPSFSRQEFWKDLAVWHSLRMPPGVTVKLRDADTYKYDRLEDAVPRSLRWSQLIW